MSDLHSLITRLRNDEKFDYIFIRGNPKQEGRQQRLKIKKYQNFIDFECDAQNLKLLNNKLKKFKPHLIINCVGLVKQKINKNSNIKNTFYIWVNLHSR